MSNIGKLQRVPLREVWPHEAYDFTAWLQDNLDILNEQLGLTLSSAEREQAAGAFSVDLIAEDEAGNPIIIENQLERSDHNHLGKLITYLAAVGANSAVWIVAEPRPEHIGAISWLNESSSGLFYLVKVEAVKIGSSEPAPLLTLIVGPSAESREVGETKKEIAERYDLRYRFWTALLERAHERTNLHANISPGQYNWVGTGAGIRGLNFNYSVRMHDAQAELYIDRGRDAEGENRHLFDQLYASREAIEAGFGEALEWEPLEGRRACRIKKVIYTGGYRDENWEETHEAMIDAMIRLEAALRPFIDELQI
jgi:hypothetical protein